MVCTKHFKGYNVNRAIAVGSNCMRPLNKTMIKRQERLNLLDWHMFSFKWYLCKQLLPTPRDITSS